MLSGKDYTQKKGSTPVFTDADYQLMQTPIMWRIKRPVRMGIKCQGCHRLARFGMTAHGGAPYSYLCAACSPSGRPVQMCGTNAELIEAVEQRNELHRRFCRMRTCECREGVEINVAFHD